MAEGNSAPLLSVEDLAVYFQAAGPGGRPALAVDGVSLEVAHGEALGLVGESGCGKSLTALAVMGLLPPAARVVRGKAVFEGRDLLGLPEAGRRALRGDRMAMVFQDPFTALNPVLAVGGQVAEVYRVHRGLSSREAWAMAVQDLRRVGIPAPEARASDPPHRLSGGMRQRVAIAMALALKPALVIADEPTTALDATVQTQVLALIRLLREEDRVAVLFIGHDLGVVAEVSDRVAVMYAGRIVEEAPAADLFAAPRHPYTAGLLGALEHMRAIPGQVPSPDRYPEGCRFAPRCDRAVPECRLAPPPMAGDGHRVACLRPLS